MDPVNHLSVLSLQFYLMLVVYLLNPVFRQVLMDLVKF